MSANDPVVLFERATARTATVMAGVAAEQLGSPTPCASWDVQQFIDHMVGGTDYLLAALAGEAPTEHSGRGLEDYTPGRLCFRRRIGDSMESPQSSSWVGSGIVPTTNRAN